MIFGVLSDSHNVERPVISAVIEEFKIRGVELVLHCGDIIPQHLDADLFGGFKVVCALVHPQQILPEFVFPPAGWCFTKPQDRVVNLRDFLVYVGHQRSFDFLLGSETEFQKMMMELTKQYDGLRFVVSGHTHRQSFVGDGHIIFLNPGAIDGSVGDYEFAIIDSLKNEAIFSRLSKTKLVGSPYTIGIISDTGNVSERDKNFWRQLALEFKERDVSSVIHCGNLWLGDIGREEFSNLEVFFNVLPWQDLAAIKRWPGNWHKIDQQVPIVEIRGHHFYVDYSLGRQYSNHSEYEIGLHAGKLAEKFQQIDYVLGGGIANPLFEGDPDIGIINPGNARKQRKFVTVCLPRNEITFGSVRLN
ncbi:MAG TPA: metallophosphoesterase family protein [bacterium]|nr:metallophosphoesterase family protein [bacterium]HNS34092.1 metallophosphoesterase family protein [bacterium]